MLKMHSPALLLILVSLLTLDGSAFARDKIKNSISKEGIIKSNEDTLSTEEDKQRLEYYKEVSDCCKTTDVLVSVFKSGGITCGGQYLVNEIGRYFSNVDPMEVKDDFQNGCLVQCIFLHNGFLTETDDHTLAIKEEEFRKEFIQKAKAKESEEVKTIASVSLDECFYLIKQYPVPADMKDMCASNSQLLISCIARYILLNCPENDWKDTQGSCKNKRIELRDKIVVLEDNAAKAAKRQLKEAEAQAQQTEGQQHTEAATTVAPPNALQLLARKMKKQQVKLLRTQAKKRHLEAQDIQAVHDKIVEIQKKQIEWLRTEVAKKAKAEEENKAKEAKKAKKAKKGKKTQVEE